MIQLSPKIISTVSAITIVTGLAVPCFAAEPDAVPAGTVQTAKRPHVDPVEARIADLHAKLQITEAQAGQWDGVARTMRSNARAVEELITTKRKNEQTMTAVEDLQAYQEIAEIHAKGAKKMEAAFEVLYATMSDDQKKVADAVFRQHKRDALATH